MERPGSRGRASSTGARPTSNPRRSPPARPLEVGLQDQIRCRLAFALVPEVDREPHAPGLVVQRGVDGERAEQQHVAGREVVRDPGEPIAHLVRERRLGVSRAETELKRKDAVAVRTAEDRERALPHGAVAERYPRREQPGAALVVQEILVRWSADLGLAREHEPRHLEGMGERRLPERVPQSAQKIAVVRKRMEGLEPLQVVVCGEVLLVGFTHRHANRHGVCEPVAAGDPAMPGQDLEDLTAQREDAVPLDHALEIEVALVLEPAAQRLAVSEEVVGDRHVGERPIVVHCAATSEGAPARCRFSQGNGSSGTGRPRNSQSGSQSPSVGRKPRRSPGLCAK